MQQGVISDKNVSAIILHINGEIELANLQCANRRNVPKSSLAPLECLKKKR